MRLGVLKQINLQTALLVAAFLIGSTRLRAQSDSQAAARTGTSTLDIWIVSKFRGANLLPDSVVSRASFVSGQTYPRIESVVTGETLDTLYAVMFSSRVGTQPMFKIGARTRVMDASGIFMPGFARIAGQRAFRAPRVPGAAATQENHWRYGNAYIVVVPHVSKLSPARLYGWLIVPAATSQSP